MKAPKLKKCKVCKGEFIPARSLQMYCSFECALIQRNLDNKKAWQKEKKVIKEKLKTHSGWLNELQVVFNQYIRARDAGKPCISCDKPITDGGNASHFFAVGSHHGLRFDELNCHLSCIHCNKHLHGNLAEYRIRLPFRIGGIPFIKMEERRHQSNKMTTTEIKDKIKEYKDKIKELK